MTITPINIATEELERKFLNPVGLIPFVGTLSSSLRGTLGSAQSSIGLPLAVAAAGAGVVTGIAQQKDLSGRCFTLAREGVSLFAHGILNGIRSGFEFVPFLPLITTLPYDLTVGPIGYYRPDEGQGEKQQPQTVQQPQVVYRTVIVQ
jgi:hypothetical protein